MAVGRGSRLGFIPVVLCFPAVLIGVLAGIDPKFAVVGAFGLAFVAIIVADLAAGLTLFVGASFLEVVPLGGAAVSFSKVTGLLLAVSWLAALTTRRDTENENDFVARHPGATFVLIGLLAWVVLSALWAEEPTITPAYRLGLNMLIIPITFTAVRTSRHATWVFGAFLTGAVVSVTYGLLVAPPVAAGQDIGRLGGAGVDANELAALLVAALVIAAAFAATSRGAPIWRATCLGIVGFCLAGIVLSLSRGGLVALGVALGAAVVVGGRWRRQSLALLLAVVTAAVLYIGLGSSAGTQRLTSLDGGTGRSDIWAVGWRMVEAHPVIGVGAANFPVSSVHYLLKPGMIRRADFIVDTPKVAHNTYLEMLAELGIVGLVLFLGALGFCLWTALCAARIFERAGDQKMEVLSRALIVALLGVLASDFFLSEQYSKQLWALLALGPALLGVARRDHSEAVVAPGWKSTLAPKRTPVRS